LYFVHEQGVNGSGKHNNWSMSTDDGTNLLNVKELQNATGEFIVCTALHCVALQ
jgi:glutamine synthetase